MTADRAAAVVIFVVAVLYLRESLSFRGVAVGDVLGPTAYPALIGALAAILAAAQWVRSRPKLPIPREPFWHQHGRAVVIVASLVLYVLLLEPVGFVISTLVFLTLSHSWLGESRWPRAAGIALAITIGLWILFNRVLEGNLPAGVLQVLR